MSTFRNILIAVVAGSCIGSCAERAPLPVESGPEGSWVEINYRGERRFAQRRGGHLVIEGDIAVGPADVWRDDDPVASGDGIDVRRDPLLRLPGVIFKWPNGVVAYSLANVVAGDRGRVREGIALVIASGAAVQFNELPGTCSGDCLNFNSTNFNDSLVGRQGGTQTINLEAFVPPTKVAHEIAHALGVWHEQSRSDRGTFIRITWGNIQGCLNTATSLSGCGPGPCQAGSGTARQNAINNACCTGAQFDDGQCYMAHNFDIGSMSPQARMFDYDYDSMMHYGPTAFSKNGGATITALQTLPPGVVMGQRTHLSVSDAAGLRALYPRLDRSVALFRNTGVQPLARLAGREQDINVRYFCTVGMRVANQTIDTALLTEGLFSETCTVQSPFWTLDYAYPNSTVTTWPSSGLEDFTESGTVTVLNPGLIAMFTTPI